MLEMFLLSVCSLCAPANTHKVLAFYFRPQDIVLMLSVHYTLTYSIFHFSLCSGDSFTLCLSLPEPKSSLFRKTLERQTKQKALCFVKFCREDLISVLFPNLYSSSLVFKSQGTPYIKVSTFKWFIIFYP